jgi:hypothetical protein
VLADERIHTLHGRVIFIGLKKVPSQLIGTSAKVYTVVACEHLPYISSPISEAAPSCSNAVTAHSL